MIRKIHLIRRFSVPFLLAAFAELAILSLAPACLAQESTIQIDPVQTKIEFSLGRSMHTVHGKFTVKSGMIRFELSSGKMDGAIVVDATSGDSGNGGPGARGERKNPQKPKHPQ